MNELILLFAALFLFLFGSVILTKLIEFGFAVADKLLQNSGRILIAPFKIAFKLIMLVFKKLDQDKFTIRPIQDITPLELQQMRNTQLRNTANRHAPVEIEYTQPNRLK